METSKNIGGCQGWEREGGVNKVEQKGFLGP